jgi:pyruvate kinase
MPTHTRRTNHLLIAQRIHETVLLSLPHPPTGCLAGNHILMADGALTMRVEAVDTEAGSVTCRALNTATVRRTLTQC